ncbi:MAG: long-chain-fatty-acid--CoA ligase [Bdellovibrionales bacterium CG12_big_fil_rev_8_21_14_0_65_38_15]|nr:MAG: long-chain-fatty-acid--CoA ligase [Bdellovibrionales bacterium CG22_combo_CG10-13_8_21_14_all_38_13]PIQ53553.1 MAG: long-chain-fatty-acid--CoA ligase [Bdellovibrionales bacterium CG12_big_fil_rev_8_21_14_0_65_38_15]PIR28443.1 MAG: long-chain-fatty-acid--CoA ligase [Bdellovibrionales bacterium CG11_big_fil_rev_8_21_14_0_20_38_13]
MSKPWYSSYESGVPHEIDVTSYSSIVEILEEGFAKYSTLPSFHCMGKSYTYREMDLLSKKFASYLQNDLKLQKGDRVALMMPNILQYPVALFGVLRAGLIAVNVNPLYTARELEHQLKDSGSKAIVIFENSAHILEQVLSKTPVKHVITTQIGDFLSFPKSLLVNFVIKKVKKMVPNWSISSAVSFKDVVFGADESQYKKPTLSLNDTAFLQYTGGTTGVSKGADLTHGNIVANMVQARAWIKNLIKDGQEIIITPLPLYHIFSLTANCFIFSSVGALNVLITNPRDMPGFIKELKKWKFTAFTGVNTLFNGLLNNEEFASVDFSHLKVSLGGGMAVQRAVAERWKKVTGCPLIEAYGLTETSPAACINPMTLKDYNGTIGIPLSSTDVVIKDDDGKNVATGETGEICIKGPQVMRGYWNRPDETAQVMTDDGFFRTGDIGVMDEKGYFKIVDRKKDMILVSGFNVYPNEVEDVVVTHPKVFEAAAIGVPDDKSGEAVKVFVVKKDESLTVEELKAFCKEGLTGYKCPKHYEFRTELPKSNVGKILRKELRDPPAAQA